MADDRQVRAWFEEIDFLKMAGECAPMLADGERADIAGAAHDKVERKLTEKQFASEEDLQKYARRAVVNEVRTFYRKSNTRSKHEKDASKPDGALNGDLTNVETKDWWDARVRPCIEGLSDELRNVIVAYYQEGKSYQEIADELGIRVSAVMMRAGRGRKNLSNCLESIERRYPSQP